MDIAAPNLTSSTCSRSDEGRIVAFMFTKSQLEGWRGYWDVSTSGNCWANVQQKTIEPLMKDTIESGTLVYTDEYSIYARLETWGYDHKSVNHGRGEFARDEDGDGFCEVHVNTMEGFWSLLRSWLRPHRGISQEKLPLYLGFFEFVHNVRKRGKALLGALIELLISTDPGIQ